MLVLISNMKIPSMTEAVVGGSLCNNALEPHEGGVCSVMNRDICMVLISARGVRSNLTSKWCDLLISLRL